MRIQRSIAVISIITGTLLLSGCSIFGDFPWGRSSPASGYDDRHGSYGPYGNYPQDQYQGGRPPRQKVVINPGYHLKDRANPETHQSRDQQWISQQNDQEYTIQVGSNKSPAAVAKALYNSPKSQRAAQYKDKDGQYSGAYGTYKSREEADKAYAKLPEQVRKSASVQQWSNVKSTVGTDAPATPAASAPSRPVPVPSDKQ